MKLGQLVVLQSDEKTTDEYLTLNFALIVVNTYLIIFSHTVYLQAIILLVTLHNKRELLHITTVLLYDIHYYHNIHCHLFHIYITSLFISRVSLYFHYIFGSNVMAHKHFHN